MHEIDKNKMSDQTEFRLSEIKKLKIVSSMRLMKQNYAVKNWINMSLFLMILTKFLIVLSATSGGVSIISFFNVIGAPAGIASASLTGINKKLQDITWYSRWV